MATGGSDGVSPLEWRIGQLNVMVALTDVAAGDGGTVRVQLHLLSHLLCRSGGAQGARHSRGWRERQG